MQRSTAELKAALAGIIHKYKEPVPRNRPKAALVQRERIPAIAALCAESFPGDLLEIGCLRGNMTVPLLKVAEKYGRRVMAIDPWITGTPNCNGTEYPTFLKRTRPWRGRLDIMRLRSQDPVAIAAMKERELCFAYIDGLHKYPACLSDIHAAAHCKGIIVVDDVRDVPQVLKALYVGAQETLREAIFSREPSPLEGYILPWQANWLPIHRIILNGETSYTQET